jgi:hypothetical protein
MVPLLSAAEKSLDSSEKFSFFDDPFLRNTS